MFLEKCLAKIYYLVMIRKIFLLSFCINEYLSQGQSYLNTIVDISDCFFQRSIVFSGNGGVIYVSNSNYYISISYSVFYSCSCSNSGGAIYCTSKSILISNVCGFSCSAVSEGNFAQLNGNINSSILYISLSMCSNQFVCDSSIIFQSTYDSIDSSNSSLNKAISEAGIDLHSTQVSMRFCTLSNNLISSSRNIHYYNTLGNTQYSNIVHSNSNSNGVFYIDKGSTTIESCVIRDNSNTLFYVSGGSLLLKHNFISHTSTLSYGQISLITNN